MRVSGISIPGFKRASCVAMLAFGASAVFAAPAAAWEEEPKAPEYSLSIVEGVTTLPEESILYTSGSVRPRAETILTLRSHGGAVVAEGQGVERERRALTGAAGG